MVAGHRQGRPRRHQQGQDRRPAGRRHRPVRARCTGWSSPTTPASRCAPASSGTTSAPAAQAAEIEAKAGGKAKLIELVGNVAMTSFTLTKLLWVRQHEPKVYDRIRHMLLPKDYVRLRLTGEYAGDVSDMSGTLMLDQRKRDWSQRDPRPLPDRPRHPAAGGESHEVTGAADGRGGAATGPRRRHAGGGRRRRPAGRGGRQRHRRAEGLISATMGTSGVVFVHCDQVHDRPAEAGCRPSAPPWPGEYCMFGCVLAAGGSLQWFRNILAPPRSAAGPEAEGRPLRTV